MGERKGQNHYYPPDFDPVKHGNLNRYHGVHALRERAAKIKEGILIIRFEMPFNIWCEGCCRHVAMGVRYNAEKKKVGNYYSTPIYEFKMRCHLCENYFRIRTDPAAFDYELVEGCKRQEKRWQPGDYDGVEHTGREVTERLKSDPMFKLEHGEKDKAKQAEDVPRMEALEYHQERMRDDFLANSVLRREFRSRKKELEAQGVVDAALLTKSSLGNLPLLPEREEDKRTAALLARAQVTAGPESQELRLEEAKRRIANQSIFDQPSSSKSHSTEPMSASSTASGPGEGLAKTFKRVYTKNKEEAEAFKTSLKTQLRQTALSKSPGDLKDPTTWLGILVRKRPSTSLIVQDGPKVKAEIYPLPSLGLSALSSYSDSDDSPPVSPIIHSVQT